MGRTIGIGHQDFGQLITSGIFYVDKTMFIKEWWESGDVVTLITRPRRFGKTLNMSMVEQFFSVKYTDKEDLFHGLSVWKEETYRRLQGSYPVISISFANIKEQNYFSARRKICQILSNLYSANRFLMEESILDDKERKFFEDVSVDMDDVTATFAIHQLSLYLSRYYGKKVIILLDEYDTPMQEAYVNGYWDELVNFTRSLFNSTFKTNPYLERAILTGITRVSRESIFSDLNNPEEVTTTSNKYEASFGFTEGEVFAALDEFGLSDKRGEVKAWYDGFTFGTVRDIYNPWSIINYLDKKKLMPYWANSSSNRLIEKLLREGNKNIKQEFETLMCEETIRVEIDEQIVYNELSIKQNAIWSLLLASGYLKVIKLMFQDDEGEYRYELKLTNKEVWVMFKAMIKGWFAEGEDYNDFIQALLAGDLKAMNAYMNRVTLEMFSYFDTGKKVSKGRPESFYHGFVLGLVAELSDRYVIMSNRESGLGRYDVMLEPRRRADDAMILEFKVQDTEDEKELSDTVRAALRRIDEKKYETMLVKRGIPAGRIRKYGFAFHGKKVLIG